ncbi:hypothetical protein TNCV_46301 [Trichonephila clavipes]|nr:hypothetical protein TNCV_46301 [Trichonephila clavipes]
MEEHQAIIDKLEDQVEYLNNRKIEGEALPTPASLIMKPVDSNMGDSNMETHMKEEKELANNVSNLIAKVEVVENLTNMVQEELQSERRVRRHLEPACDDGLVWWLRYSFSDQMVPGSNLPSLVTLADQKNRSSRGAIYPPQKQPSRHTHDATYKAVTHE